MERNISCHSANGVCTTRALATALCPTRIWTSFSYDPNSCYTRSCVTTCLLPDVQTTRRKEEIVGTNTGFLCSDGQCVADASLCEQEKESSTIVTALETDLSSLDLSYKTLLPLTNIDTGSLIGRVEFAENTFAVGTRLTVEPTSFTALAELLGEDEEGFAEKIVSPVVTLRARDLTSGEELGEKGFLSPVRIVLAPVREVNVTDVCIAYLNVTLKEWICLENTTIASVEPLLLTAVTPHFTDFSVILTGSPSDGGDGDGEDGVEDGYGYTDGDDGYNEDGDGNADDGGDNDDIGALDDAAKTEEGGDEDWMAPVLGGVVGGVVLLVVVFAAGVAVVWYVRKAKLRREGGSNVVNFEDDLELSD
ncbi:Shell matrix protein [Balamuthia mandrillaris]